MCYIFNFFVTFSKGQRKGQCQVVQWIMVSTKWPPYIVQCGKFNVFCDLSKRSRKCHGQNNRSCAQLHHHSELLKPWSKVNIKRFNELWCPQSSPQLFRTHVHTHTQTDGRYYKVPTGYAEEQNSILDTIYLRNIAVLLVASGVGCSKTSQICNICDVLAMPQGQICVVLARVVQNVCKHNANYRCCSDNAPMTQTAELAAYEVFMV